MSVYVDNPQNCFGNMKMCHMIADSTEELLKMVDIIKIQRQWIQNQGTYREHFDICLSKRKLAIKNGAIEVSTYTIIKILRGKQNGRHHTLVM